MQTSRMNLWSSRTIIKSILDVSRDHFMDPEIIRHTDKVPRGFKYSLERILSDFKDQITVGAVGRPLPSTRLLPETHVLDSWRDWSTGNRSTIETSGNREVIPVRGREVVLCTFQVTVDFIDKISRSFHEAAERYVGQLNFTWGTLLRYLTFINTNSEGIILKTVDGGCSWDDHMCNVWNTWDCSDMFNDEEALCIESHTRERALELGYLVDQPVPEPTPAQRSNESLRKLQDIIDSVSRGENAEINEGEYLELSQYLKSLFVT